MQEDAEIGKFGVAKQSSSTDSFGDRPRDDATAVKSSSKLRAQTTGQQVVTYTEYSTAEGYR